ncbi:MAG: VWA domain-containing protein, partial [Vicinamibacterales bacterium]
MKLSAAVVVLVSVAGLSQAPQFHSGVQLITLNVSVLDKSGNAVTDLRPSDFSVLVDGKPRVVRFAQLFHSERSPIVVSSDHSLGRYATNTDAPTGHVVVFAIDRYALPPGTERPILTSAAGMLDRLSLADSVGLVNIPGTTIDVTRDHPLIARALESIVGMSQPGMSQRSVTWPEAKAIDAGDNLVLAQVVERECLSPDDSYCQQDIHTAVRETLGYGREHADMVLASLTSIVNHLAVIRAPKHIVLLSAGLPFDTEFLDRFKAVERAAAQSHVTIDTIRVHTFAADATSPVKGGVAPEGTADRAGLDTLASLTGGTAFLASGRDTGIFTRLISQVTTFYQLGVESSAS